MKKPEEGEKPDTEKRAEEIKPEVEDYLDLRPRKLSEYIGQKQVVETLDIAIQAAKKRGEPIDHILFHSPPRWWKNFFTQPWKIFASISFLIREPMREAIGIGWNVSPLWVPPHGPVSCQHLFGSALEY
jgi:hypothetical protein